MVIYREWVDFVIYGDAYLIHSPEQRIDISKAIDLDKDKLSTDANLLQIIQEQGFIMKKQKAVKEWDEFEAMEINHKGDVIIWTKRYVGYLSRIGYERMVYLDRHPPPSREEEGLSTVSTKDKPLISPTSKINY